MFVFAYAYTLEGFLDNYVYQHLLMYPLIIIIIAIVMVLGIRYKGSFFVDLVADNKKKYYTRINYRILTGITIATVATICILLLVGVLYNTTMSEKLDNTIDTVFGAAMHTSENIQKVNTSLIGLQARLRAGIGGSSIINASQEAIIRDVNVVNAQLTELSTYLSNFSASNAQSAANASAQARAILISLQNYPQLRNIPDPSEVPLISENEIKSDFDDAQKSIVEAKNELGRIKNEVTAVGNVSYDFSSVISSITSARRSLVDVNKQVLDLYDKKDGLKKDVKYFDRIRIEIIVLTYVFPLLIAVAGLLAIEMRTSSVVRAWYHILLVGAALCGIFAGIYMAISIVIEDACHDTETTLFVALRSAYPDYEEKQWYHDLVEYYPLVTSCNSTDDILDYLDLPAEFLTALEDPSTLIANVSINYTALLANATNKLDSGLVSIRDINYAALDGDGIKAKLVNVQQQLTNLTAFGFSMSVYDAALKRINDQTNSVPATYPNGTTIILSFFYLASQVSSIDLDADPYVYTTQSYRDQLSTSISDFLQLDQQYKDTVILTSEISANVTRLIGIIDELEDYSNALRGFQAGVDQRGNQIRRSMNNIGSGVSDLTTNVIPAALGITATRDVVIAATRCLYITAAYKAAENFVCNSAMDASAAFIATHSLAGCALLVANLAAGYAFIAFGFPYKPYSHSPYIHFTAEDEHSISFSTSLAIRSYPYYALSPKRGYKYMLL